MSLALQFTLTQAGLAAVFNARKTGLELALTHIQLGSGQATPQGLETALIAPQQTALIASGSQVTPTQIRMSATFSGDAAYAIGEIGVWAGAPDAAGSVLVAYWSRPAAPVAHKSAGVDFIFTHDMAIADALGAGGGLTVHIDPTHAGTTALVAAHEAAADPHPQYLREDEAQAIAQQAVQQAVQPLAAQQASHTTHPDPHPQYLTQEEWRAITQELIGHQLQNFKSGLQCINPITIYNGIPGDAEFSVNMPTSLFNEKIPRFVMLRVVASASSGVGNGYALRFYWGNELISSATAAMQKRGISEFGAELNSYFIKPYAPNTRCRLEITSNANNRVSVSIQIVGYEL